MFRLMAGALWVLSSLRKLNPGEPKNAAMGAFTAHVNVKTVIVVDPDINIYRFFLMCYGQ